MSPPGQLLIFGLGYSASAVAAAAVAAGFRVVGTSRRADRVPLPGVELIPPDEAGRHLVSSTHWLAGAPPDETGDPMLTLFGSAMARCRPSWIGYFSTTGVYGDRGGDWVDEASQPRPTGPRGTRRMLAEQQWRDCAAQLGSPLDLLRLAGIYGPSRSVFEALRAGTSRRIDAPGHRFGRIHRDDIAGATLAAMTAAARSGIAARVLNLSDDEPAESAQVIAEAARLLDLPLPPSVPLPTALRSMSPMGRSFWSENRRVSSRLTQEWLARQWLYASFREGLRAILAAGG